MRYDRIVYLRTPLVGTYNPETGNYDGNTYSETKVVASVVNTDATTLRLVYGELVQGSMTIHLQNKLYADIYDSVRIGTKVYRIDRVRRFRNKESLVVTEVQ